METHELGQLFWLEILGVWYCAKCRRIVEVE